MVGLATVMAGLLAGCRGGSNEPEATTTTTISSAGPSADTASPTTVVAPSSVASSVGTVVAPSTVVASPTVVATTVPVSATAQASTTVPVTVTTAGIASSVAPSVVYTGPPTSTIPLDEAKAIVADVEGRIGQAFAMVADAGKITPEATALLRGATLDVAQAALVEDTLPTMLDPALRGRDPSAPMITVERVFLATPTCLSLFVDVDATQRLSDGLRYEGKAMYLKQADVWKLVLFTRRTSDGSGFSCVRPLG